MNSNQEEAKAIATLRQLNFISDISTDTSCYTVKASEQLLAIVEDKLLSENFTYQHLLACCNPNILTETIAETPNKTIISYFQEIGACTMAKIILKENNINHPKTEEALLTLITSIAPTLAEDAYNRIIEQKT